MDHSKTLSISNSKEIKTLIKRLVQFFMICLLVLGVIFFVNKLLINASPLVVDKEVDTVFLGDSRIRGGLAANLVPNSANLAQKAEPTQLSLYKLEHLLKHNEQIKTIVIGLSYENISKSRDNIFVGRWGNEMVERSYPLVPFRDILNFNVNYIDVFRVYGKHLLTPNFTYLKNLFLEPSERSIPFEEKWNPSDNKRLKKSLNLVWNKREKIPKFKVSEKKLIGKTNVHFAKIDGEYVSEEIPKYLKKIHEVCQANNINLVILGMPLHPDYIDVIPEETKNRYQEIKNSYANLENVFFWDYSNAVDFMPFYRDHDHLNGLGKLYFTNSLVNAFTDKKFSKQPQISDQKYGSLAKNVNLANKKPNEKFVTNKRTKGHIARINDIIIAKAEQPIVFNQDEEINIVGWAFDNVKKTLASKIMVNIGDEIERVSKYGGIRPAVRKMHGNDLANCGFKLKLPPNTIEKGEHTIDLMIHSLDGSTIYQGSRSVNIIIE